MREMENMSSNNGETTVAVSAPEAIPSMVSTTAISLNTHIGPILSPVRTQGQYITPPPVGFSVFKPYATGFTMPLNGQEQ